MLAPLLCGYECAGFIPTQDISYIVLILQDFLIISKLFFNFPL